MGVQPNREKINLKFEYIFISGIEPFEESLEMFFSTGPQLIVGPNGTGKTRLLCCLAAALGCTSPLASRGVVFKSNKDVIYSVLSHHDNFT